MKFTIKGMHCKSCKALIEDVLDDMNIKVVSFDVNEEEQLGQLQIEADNSAEDIIKAIQEEGEYTVTGS